MDHGLSTGSSKRSSRPLMTFPHLADLVCRQTRLVSCRSWAPAILLTVNELLWTCLLADLLAIKLRGTGPFLVDTFRFRSIAAPTLPFAVTMRPRYLNNWHIVMQ